MERTTIMNFNEFLMYYDKAASIPFNFEEMCDVDLQELVMAQAGRQECNPECIFFPLLTCAASCIGSWGSVQISPDVYEQLILWSLVVQKPDQARLNVLNIFESAIKQIEDENRFNNATCEFYSEPQFLVNTLDLKNLHKIMLENGGYGLGIFNDIKEFKDVVCSPQTHIDVKLLTDLNSGLPWTLGNSRHNNKNSIERQNFNIAIMVYPTALFKALYSKDDFSTLLMNNFFFVCAKKHSSTVSSKSALNLSLIFKRIYDIHKLKSIVYLLSKNAQCKLYEAYGRGNNEFRTVVRIAGTLHVLNQVIDSKKLIAEIDLAAWDIEISLKTILQAEKIYAYVSLQKKFLLESFYPIIPSNEPRIKKTNRNAPTNVPPTGARLILNARSNVSTHYPSAAITAVPSSSQKKSFPLTISPLPSRSSSRRQNLSRSKSPFPKNITIEKVTGRSNLTFPRNKTKEKVPKNLSISAVTPRRPADKLPRGITILPISPRRQTRSSVPNLSKRSTSSKLIITPVTKRSKKLISVAKKKSKVPSSCAVIDLITID